MKYGSDKRSLLIGRLEPTAAEYSVSLQKTNLKPDSIDRFIDSIKERFIFVLGESVGFVLHRTSKRQQ